MRVNPFCGLVAACLLFAPCAAVAQQSALPNTELDINVAALASIQPADDVYVGAPYLDRGLGGVGPGLGIALTLRHRMLAASLEWSAAHLEVEQRGRLADDRSTGRLRDTSLSVLAGPEIPVEALRFRLLAGISRLGGGPTADGVPIDETPEGLPLREGAAKYAPTAGVDLHRRWNGRVGLLGTLRYSHIGRSEGARQRGVGPHVVRVGVGLSFRVAASIRPGRSNGAAAGATWPP